MKRLFFIFLMCTAFAWQSQAQWFENFDASMGLPEEWNLLNEDGGNQWIVKKLYSAHSEENVVSIKYNYNAHDDYLITPLVENVNDDNSQLSFWVKSYDPHYLEPFDIRISTNGNSNANDFFIIVDEQEAPNHWKKIEVDLSAYFGQDVYVAIHATGKYKFYLYVDDVKNYGKAACPLATGLTESNISLNEATLNWDSEALALEWEVIYGLTGFDPSTEGTTVSATTNSYTLRNLEHSTRYDWYVRNLCGDAGSAELSEVKTFETLCSAITTFPFEEDFSSDMLPRCWSQEYVTGDRDWSFRYGEAEFKFGNNYSTKLVMPVLDISNMNNPSLIFEYKIPEIIIGSDELRIYYKNSLNNDWVLIAEYIDPTVFYVYQRLSLPEPSANYYIAFEGKAASGFSTYIDNIVVEDMAEQAIIEINPIDFNFGNSPTNQLSEKDFIISNTGNLDLEINEISQNGSSSFSFLDETPITIASGDLYTFTVTFIPNAEGLYTGTLSINNNTAVIPTISLEGISRTGGSCEDPFVVDSYPYHTSGSTCGLGDNYNNTAMNNYDSGEDAIYKIVVSEKSILTFTMSSTTTYTGMGLFEGCPNINNLIDKITNGSAGIKTITDVTLSPGEYYLMLDIWGPPSCYNFELSITAEVIEMPQAAIWTGDVNDDWFLPENWDVNALPGDITAVTIPSGLTTYPNIYSNGVAICKNITLEQGATLLNFNSLTIIEKAHIKYTYSGGTNVYHNISTPVVKNYNGSSNFEPLEAGSIFPPSTYMTRYNEVNDEWINLLAADPLNIGEGYLIWLQNSSEDVVYSGDFYNETVDYSLSHTDNLGYGWHLIGNPYPAALQYNKIESFTSTDIDNTMYIWDPTAGAYKTWNGSTGDIANGIIPVTQAFFVQAKTNNANFSINMEDCVANSTFVYKSEEDQILSINIKNLENGYEESTFLQIREDAKVRLDEFDGEHLNGLNETPKVYTQVEGTELSINSYDIMLENVSVFFNTNINGNFILTINENSIENAEEMYIEDTQTGLHIPITYTTEYKFYGTNNDDEQRFIVHFKSTTDIVENTLENINIFSNKNHQIVIENERNKSLNICLYDVTGKLISAKKSSQVISHINVSEIGVYLVTVQNDNGVQTKKVVIQ